jgi:hypothetical protein
MIPTHNEFACEDECAIHRGSTYSTGWAMRGKKPLHRGEKPARSDKLNISMTVTSHGMADLTLKWGQPNDMGFNKYDISNMLWAVIPDLPPNMIYLWDRASIHTATIIKNHA